MPSSVIRSYHYNEDKQRLTIVFVSDTVYEYLHVPAKVYEKMKAAKSKGIYFNEFIKDKYEFVRGDA